MAHLWKEQPELGLWERAPLDGEGALALPAPSESVTSNDAAALLLRSRADDGDAWLIMAATPRGVSVNGEPLRTGVRVLVDRDEIRVAGLGSVFFSTESLPVIEPFPGSEEPVYCPRCKEPLAAGTPAVRCPGCQRWYHQSAEWPCFTYAERCAVCPHPTALDAGFQWSPDDL